MNYPLTHIVGIDREMASRLKAAGVRSAGGLLATAFNPKGRRELAEKTGLGEKQILCWANLADKLRVKGIGKEHAELLHAAGVETVRDLKYRNPANLAKAVAAANARRKLVRILPSEKAVQRWIDNAKKLQLKIKY
jgi:predicted flap endonuclease-1-like 5' DNA nuclease